MNIGRTIFSQLTDYIDEYIFTTIVEKHNGNERVRHFTCSRTLSLHAVCTADEQRKFARC